MAFPVLTTKMKLIAIAVLAIGWSWLVWSARGWKEDHAKLKQANAVIVAQSSAQSSQHSEDKQQNATDSATAADAAKKLASAQRRERQLLEENNRLRAAGAFVEARHEDPNDVSSPTVTVRSECYRMRYNAALGDKSAEGSAACSESGLSARVPSEQLQAAPVVQ